MTVENEILRRLETIQNIFRKVQDAFREKIFDNDSFSFLDNYDIEYRGIAYEAASMCIALNDLKAGTKLKRWKGFFEMFESYGIQIHIGLGWAFAQQQLDPL